MIPHFRYVLLTARQPFTSPKAQDPMEVMRRIVDERWPIRYAPYMSEESKDLVSRLLERKPVKRIGCFQGRASDIKRHPWFKVSSSTVQAYSRRGVIPEYACPLLRLQLF